MWAVVPRGGHVQVRLLVRRLGRAAHQQRRHQRQRQAAAQAPLQSLAHAVSRHFGEPGKTARSPINRSNIHSSYKEEAAAARKRVGSGMRVSVSVDLCGRRIFKKKKYTI